MTEKNLGGRPNLKDVLLPIIVTVLKEKQGKKMTVYDLYNELLRQGHKYAYSTVNRWATVAYAMRKIRMERYGRTKVIWYE